HRLSDRETAHQHFVESVEIQAQLVAEFPSIRKYRMNLRGVLGIYTADLRRIYKSTDLLNEYETVLSLLEKTLSKIPGESQAEDLILWSVIVVNENAGKLLEELNKPAAACKHYE